MSAHVEISKKLVFVNSTSAILNQLLGLTVLVWLQQYLINNISETEYAVFALVGSLILFVPLLVIVISGGLARFVTEAYARGDERRVTQIVSTIAPIFAGIGLFVLSAGWLLAWNVDHVLTIEPGLEQDAQLMFGILVLTAAARLSCMPFTVGLQVRQKFVWIHLTHLVGQLLWIATLFALLFGVSTKALWVPVASLPQAAFELVTLCVLSRRVLPAARFRWSERRRGIAGPMMSFGGWTMVGRIAAVARETCGILMLNELPAARDSVARAIEVNCLKLGSLVETKLYPTMLVPLSTTLPLFTAMHATGQDERLRRTYFRLCRFVLWAFLAAGVPMVVFREELWQLYITDGYATYGDAATVMMLLLLKSVVIFAQPVLAQVVGARNQTRPLAIRVVLIDGTTVLLTLLAIVVFEVGAVGVAAVSLAVTLVGSPLLNWQLGLGLTGATLGSWLRYTVWPGVLPALLATPACLAVRALNVPDTWIELGLSAAAGLVVYGAALVAFSLQPTDRADLQKVLEKVSARLRRR